MDLWVLGEEKRNSHRGKKGTTKVCSRGHWRPAEDSKLKDLVSQFGPQNWNLISDHLTGRSGKSCRLRWFNQLDPRVNKRAFSQEEEEKLLSAHRLYGNKWAVMARLFPGRTDNAIKNHWHIIMARKTRQHSNSIHYMSGAGRKTFVPSIRLLQGNVGKGSSVNLAEYGNGNNAYSDSTNNEDKSVSTLTDLSLSTPSGSQPHVWFSNDAHGAVQKLGNFDNEAVVENNQNYEKDGSCDSDSSDTVGRTAATCTRSDENISILFFDFLGVGAA